ncbi:MAG: flagellar basal body L-ring protein FlgH [Planctomycetota bacterium]
MKASLWIIVLAGTATAFGQSLYERPVQAAATDVETIREEAEPVPEGPPTLEATSLYYVEPEEPREFLAEDLVTIIISERTEIAREQTLESGKEYTLEGGVTAIPDFAELIELRLAQGDSLAEIGMNWSSEFTGEGEYERDDEVTARVTARVVEVKPNGNLLLEARTVVTTDEETQTITLTGYCRSEDVSVSNTIQSNEMYDLQLNMQHEGELKRSGKKGLIPRVLETLFHF